MEIAQKKLREDAGAIFHAGLRAVEPAAAVRRHVQRDGNFLIVADRQYDLRDFKSIFVIGAGKAACPMAAVLEEILAERLTGGQVNVKYGHLSPLKKIHIQEAGHPIPDAAGVRGAEKILSLLRQADERALVIGVISGGGSALLPLPAVGINLEDKQAATKLLLACGATINEINAVRKHISQVKGGQLARAVYPATLLTLLLSDVIGDRLDVIASGPTAPDASTFKEAQLIFEKYNILASLPASIKKHITRGLAGAVAETPKAGDPIFKKTQNLIVANNRQAIAAAKAEAQKRGYQTLILSTLIEGETREIARMHAAIAKEIHLSGNPLSPPACVISGGETTVTLHGTGRGGRNQEFVLAAAQEISGWPDTVILSAGTDGTDGPTEAAGAICDHQTVARALALGLNLRTFLSGNDSYHFFEKLGDLMITGPTNTNVMDLRIMLAGSP